MYSAVDRIVEVHMWSEISGKEKPIYQCTPTNNTQSNCTSTVNSTEQMIFSYFLFLSILFSSVERTHCKIVKTHTYEFIFENWILKLVIKRNNFRIILLTNVLDYRVFTPINEYFLINILTLNYTVLVNVIEETRLTCFVVLCNDMMIVFN